MCPEHRKCSKCPTCKGWRNRDLYVTDGQRYLVCQPCRERLRILRPRTTDTARFVPRGVLPRPDAPPPIPAGPTKLADTFRCIKYAITITYEFCLLRRKVRAKAFQGRTFAKEARHPYCSDQCLQGAQNAQLVQLGMPVRLSLVRSK